jgi:hypothetical protein
MMAQEAGLLNANAKAQKRFPISNSSSRLLPHATIGEQVMLKLLTLTLPLLSAPSAEQWPTYAMGPSYALVEYGCQRKEDSLSVASTYEVNGSAAAWKLLLTMGKRLSSDGRAMCMKIDADFVFTSLPIFETEIDAGIGETQRLSVVHADTAKGNSYWLLVRNAHFVAD